MASTATSLPRYSSSPHPSPFPFPFPRLFSLSFLPFSLGTSVGYHQGSEGPREGVVHQLHCYGRSKVRPRRLYSWYHSPPPFLLLAFLSFFPNSFISLSSRSSGAHSGDGLYGIHGGQGGQLYRWQRGRSTCCCDPHGPLGHRLLWWQ